MTVRVAGSMTVSVLEIRFSTIERRTWLNARPRGPRLVRGSPRTGRARIEFGARDDCAAGGIDERHAIRPKAVTK